MSRPRRFVPESFDPMQWDQVESLFGLLDTRPVDQVDQLKQWLADYSELTAVINEAGSRRSIDHSCHTNDPEIEKAYFHWVREIYPNTKPWHDKLQRKLLSSPGLDDLIAQEPRLGMLERSWRNDVELFCEDNIALQTRLTELASEYDKLIGAMVVEFDGKRQTLQQLACYQESTDRAKRREAFLLTVERRLQDRDAIDEIFEKQLKVRADLARNKDLPDYRAYAWKSRERFDYSPQDCLDFHEAVEKYVVPAAAKLDEAKRDALGLEVLRPWDASVDVKGRDALEPFDPDNVQTLVDKSEQILGKVSPVLGEMFGRLQMGRNFDLESREGKRAGGYQSSLTETGEPFIFMNAAGLQRDAETMLHEAGHAFHFMWAYEAEPLVFLQHAPIEFCEVASMSMELMTLPHYGEFYQSSEDADRARRAQLEGSLRVLPWIATIDAYQHWLYTHEDHTREERYEAWGQIRDRFATGVVDWSDDESTNGLLTQAHDAMWQRQLHLVHFPFYYIEYGIAQLGAFQMWLNHREDPDQAIESYRTALKLGNTQSLSRLFETAGLRFDFSSKTLEPLMQKVIEALDEMPA